MEENNLPPAKQNSILHYTPVIPLEWIILKGTNITIYNHTYEYPQLHLVGRAEFFSRDTRNESLLIQK